MSVRERSVCAADRCPFGGQIDGFREAVPGYAVPGPSRQSGTRPRAPAGVAETTWEFTEGR